MKKFVALTLVLVISISLKSYSQTNQENKASESVDTLKATDSKKSQGSSILKKVTISGYVQPQLQVIQSRGAPSIAGGNFEPNTSNRLMIRRGRLKATFETKNVEYAIQFNATERGVNLDEVYLVLSLPFLKMISITTGIFNRPFSYEINYSLKKLESAERSRIFKSELPNEKDLGVMLTFKPTGSEIINSFTFDAGLFNGTGPYNRDFDNRKDFIARLYFDQSAFSDIVNYHLGVSFLQGGFDNQRNNHYAWNNGFELLPNDTLARAIRSYRGIEGQISVKWLFGETLLRGEYAFGLQSSTLASNKTPSIAPNAPAVTRDVTGGYLLFLHNIRKTKIQLVAKFDWMDPNSKISGNNIGLLPNTGMADIKYSTLGFGMNYYFNTNLKLLAYYELITNETTTHVPEYTSDLKDNLFTLRIQYQFK